MIIKSPCEKYLQKGCGSYHNKCKDYQEFLKKNDENKVKIKEYKEKQYGGAKRK